MSARESEKGKELGKQKKRQENMTPGYNGPKHTWSDDREAGFQNARGKTGNSFRAGARSGAKLNGDSGKRGGPFLKVAKSNYEGPSQRAFRKGFNSSGLKVYRSEIKARREAWKAGRN